MSTFEKGIYYTIDDIQEITLLDKNTIVDELIKHNIPFEIVSSSYRVYNGKDISPIFKTMIPMVDNDGYYTLEELSSVLGIDVNVLYKQYVRIRGLKTFKVKRNIVYYYGKHINDITELINFGYLPIIPVRFDDKIYTEKQVVSKLGLNLSKFNRIYINTYHLENENTKLKDKNVVYNGYRVNAITNEILSLYGMKV